MPIHRLNFSAMASACEVVLDAPSPQEASRLAQPAIDEVRRIEQRFSRYRADSVVSRVNACAGGDPVPCDSETLSLLDFAQQMYQQSGGLFDITSGVLRRAWNWVRGVLPDPATIEALLPLIGWHQVQREGNFVRLPRAGMELDFGGFGKEYAADRAAAALAEAGVRHGYVNLGGDLRLVGPRPDGSPWLIGIQHPRTRDRVLATQQMVSGGLATSGDYERFMVADGRRYCHVLHPRTGWPVSHWQSISVTAPVAALAGCISTIAMLKEAAGLDFLQASGCKYLAVDQDGRVFNN